MERKGYTTLTKELLNLSLNEIWIYAIIKSFRKKEGYSDLTYKQIALYSGMPEKTVEKIVPALKNNTKLFSKVVKIEVQGSKMRNNYYFTETDNYFFVKNELFTDPNKDKAILLLIKSLCLNNTNECKLSINKISELTGMHRATLTKYIKLAISNDWLTEDLTIKDENIVESIYKKNSVREINAYNYNVIKEFCECKGVSAPFNDRKLIGYITPAFSMCDDSLKKVLEERCSTLPEKVSLTYFIKVLRNIKVEQKQEQTVIIL